MAAGDGWVMDIIWHVGILAVKAVTKFLSSWSIECLLTFSFVTHVVLTIFAGFRWRGTSGVRRFIIWPLYVGADYVATTALGKISVNSASGEHQLVAFWAPFLLLHLGGPDNITAYELEDNELSKRYFLGFVLQLLGAFYVIYNSISGNWTLKLAAWLMYAVGFFKYGEKILALHRANLGTIRSSLQKEQPRRRHHYPRSGLPEVEGKERDLVMRAHSLFHIVKLALVDSSFDMEPGDASDQRRNLLSLEWDKFYRVVEVELSLMYDFLYTKASVIHTWHGYCIRVCSPVATAVAYVLFEVSDENGHRRADVVITRILLAGTVLLETASLIRALGSSWTAFQSYTTRARRWGWLRHHVWCTARGRWFLRVFASLGWLLKMKGHRRWSGNIGQLNLLQLSVSHRPASQQQASWRAANEEVGQDQSNYHSGDEERYSVTLVIPDNVKELLFRRLQGRLKDLWDKMGEIKERLDVDPDLMRNLAKQRTRWGHQTLRKYDLHEDLHKSLRMSLGDELQEGILTWHIATDIYLLKSNEAKLARDHRMETIRLLSNYMMYLLVVRPDMLPGIVYRRLHELTIEDLLRIQSKDKDGLAQGRLEFSPSFWNSCCVVLRKIFRLHPHDDPNSPWQKQQRQDKLASFLFDKRDEWDADGYKSYLQSYLPFGIELAEKLLRMDETPEKLDVLEVLLGVWVDMLFYAGFRCRRESHAKQLSHGGELTTVVWLMAEHLGMFPPNRKAKAAREKKWK